jgi:hypothetical protein
MLPWVSDKPRLHSYRTSDLNWFCGLAVKICTTGNTTSAKTARQTEISLMYNTRKITNLLHQDYVEMLINISWKLAQTHYSNFLSEQSKRPSELFSMRFRAHHTPSTKIREVCVLECVIMFAEPSCWVTTEIVELRVPASDLVTDTIWSNDRGMDIEAHNTISTVQLTTIEYNQEAI